MGGGRSERVGGSGNMKEVRQIHRARLWIAWNVKRRIFEFHQEPL